MTERSAERVGSRRVSDQAWWHVAIGVHVHAEPERLHATLASLKANTEPRYSLLLLPDGPDTETVAALSALGDVPQSATELPYGAPACFNRLASSADADVIVLLESGALVGPGWLERLLTPLADDPANGLSGPSTNSAWNEQCQFPRASGDAMDIARTATDATRRFGTSWRTLAPLYSLADFCYAVRREVLLTIGGADEAYGAGPCWEMDYNIRAARAGFRGVWACGSYVHRSPPTPRRRRDEEARFEASKHRYQDKFCGLRLHGERGAYESHCRGDTCAHFAPATLIELRRPLVLPGRPTPAQASDSRSTWRARTEPAVDVVAAARSPSRAVGTNRLVSCVMPTRGRAAFALQAVEYFLRQDYHERELIILDDDDGEDLTSRLPANASIRYLRVPAGQTIGAKRNRGCQAASGGLIAQWDDDDWYAPNRLSAQVTPLLSGDADVTALHADVFFDLDRWRFWSCSAELHRRLFMHDVHGGTLVYRRDVWQRLARYPDASLAEDAAFLRRAVANGARLKKLRDPALFMYLRHGCNSWSFACGKHVDPQGWVRMREPPLPVSDRAFYAAQRESADAESERRQRSPAPSPDRPLVSCIMPTADRRAFVPQAIHYFLRQDYAERELVVVEDGEHSVADLIPDDPRIRYTRLDGRHVIGAKRNVACELARGEIVAHWDDDDWMADHRLSYQVRALLARPDAEVCGLSRILFYDPSAGAAWQYVCPEGKHGWVAGNTLCYRKSWWERHRFPEVQEGEDTRFVDRVPQSAVVALDDNTFFVGVIHARNTSPKQTGDSRWHRVTSSGVREIMRADWSFYDGVRNPTDSLRPL